MSVSGKNPRIAVVSGGISGIGTAFRWDRPGRTVELTEHADTQDRRFGVGKVEHRLSSSPEHSAAIPP